MRDWYRQTVTPEPVAVSRNITWLDIFPHWNAACLDLSEVHRIDMWSGILDHRSWVWLELHVLDMVQRGPRLSAALKAATPITEPEGGTSGA